MDRVTPNTRKALTLYAYGFLTGVLVHVLVVFIMRYLGAFIGFTSGAGCQAAGGSGRVIAIGLLAALGIYGVLGLLAGLRAEHASLPTGFSADPRLNAAITISAVFALLIGALHGLLVFNACYLAG